MDQVDYSILEILHIDFQTACYLSQFFKHSLWKGNVFTLILTIFGAFFPRATLFREGGMATRYHTSAPFLKVSFWMLVTLYMFFYR